MVDAVQVRSRPSRYTIFGRMFRDEGDTVRIGEFSDEEWAAIRTNENLIVSRAAVTRES